MKESIQNPVLQGFEAHQLPRHQEHLLFFLVDILMNEPDKISQKLERSCLTLDDLKFIISQSEDEKSQFMAQLRAVWELSHQTHIDLLPIKEKIDKVEALLLTEQFSQDRLHLRSLSADMMQKYRKKSISVSMTQFADLLSICPKEKREVTFKIYHPELTKQYPEAIILFLTEINPEALEHLLEFPESYAYIKKAMTSFYDSDRFFEKLSQKNFNPRLCFHEEILTFFLDRCETPEHLMKFLALFERPGTRLANRHAFFNQALFQNWWKSYVQNKEPWQWLGAYFQFQNKCDLTEKNFIKILNFDLILREIFVKGELDLLFHAMPANKAYYFYFKTGLLDALLPQLESLADLIKLYKYDDAYPFSLLEFFGNEKIRAKFNALPKSTYTLLQVLNLVPVDAREKLKQVLNLNANDQEMIQNYLQMKNEGTQALVIHSGRELDSMSEILSMLADLPLHEWNDFFKVPELNLKLKSKERLKLCSPVQDQVFLTGFYGAFNRFTPDKWFVFLTHPKLQDFADVFFKYFHSPYNDKSFITNLLSTGFKDDYIKVLVENKALLAQYQEVISQNGGEKIFDALIEAQGTPDQESILLSATERGLRAYAQAVVQQNRSFSSFSQIPDEKTHIFVSTLRARVGEREREEDLPLRLYTASSW